MSQPPPEPLRARLRRLRGRETDPARIRLLDFVLADLGLNGEAVSTARQSWPDAAALLDRIEVEHRKNV